LALNKSIRPWYLFSFTDIGPEAWFKAAKLDAPPKETDNIFSIGALYLGWFVFGLKGGWSIKKE